VVHGLHKEMGCWCAYLSGARCRLAYGPADATALTVFCFSKIQTDFPFMILAHPGSPGQRAVRRVCECVRVRAYRRLVHSKMSPQGSLSLYIVPCDVLALFAGICQL